MKRKVVYFDVLNILSCIAVVAMHMNAASWQYSEGPAWRQALFIEVFCYFAVPVFLMISGANLMEYRSRETTYTFFKKRLRKIIIPYIFWVIIYLVFYSITGDVNWGGVSFNIQQIINSFTAYSTQAEFWFFQVIICVYLSIPLLSLTAFDEYRVLRRYLIAVGIIVSYILPIINNNTFIKIGGNYDFFVVTGFLVYPLLGYEIHHSKIKRSHVVIAVIAAILFDGVRFLGTIYYSITQGELSRVFYGYVTLFALIPAVAIFSLCKVVRWDNIFSESQKIVLSRISSCSFGVYLIHLIIMRVYAKLFRQSLISLGFRTYGVIVVYVACVVIVYAIKKIPIVKNIVP